MSNFSNITIAGRLTRDVEQRTAGEHTVYNVGIAYDTGFGDKKKPCFIDISAWDKTGAALARLAKGEPVLINGSLELETWEKDGQKRSKHVVRVNSVTYISSKRDGVADTATTRPVSAAAANAFDAVPF